MDIFLAFYPHSNAIIDLCFTLDDSLLATASGDQTSKVVDMTTQTTISVLSKHSASLKQVRFQPGTSNNSIIATSSRDGCVKIWDLRCRVTDPVQGIYTHTNGSEDITPHSSKSKIGYSRTIGGIYNAHHPLSYLRSSNASLPGNGRTRAERSGRNGDISVTAVTFLPEGKEHLLLTGSEANASVKLWDVRSLHNTRRKTTVPLSCTAQPRSHTQWRYFGINSLSLSYDGSRLYTLCKDNTVYAYSVAHLILGQAPELSSTSVRGRQRNAEYQEGPGPLYGFRHQQLHATSFYVKSAIRPARLGRVEMLAVGSCDGCIILFPTDEKYLQLDHKSEIETSEEWLRVREIGNNLCNSTRFDDDIRISYNGTPLVRGHDREVGALAWTPSGELITVGDDFLVRCWREGKEASKLRTGGEQCGRRWNCGWADVSSSYDEEE
jgi:WD40 repeat protein